MRKTKKDVGNVDVGEYWNCIGGENATCNICLGYTEKWAKKNAEKVREIE